MKKAIPVFSLTAICILFFINSINAQIGCIDSSLIMPTGCPLIYLPVCGCDGNTYVNDCVGQSTAGITSWTPGPCNYIPCFDPTLLDPNGICPAIYDPVCGCNGITYSNSCEAQIQGGNLYWTYGPCGTPCPDPNIIDQSTDCFTSSVLPSPVCGCDGQTYANSCVAESHFGINTWTPGPCYNGNTDCENTIQTGTSFVCPTISNPVCGCDGQTYNNACEAALVGGLTDWTSGPCTTPCVDPNLIDNSASCSLAYNPICGCDDETYFNPCVAQNYFGISTWTAGVCDASICYNPDQIVSSINCSSAATQVICGCDNITYQNACEAYYLGGILNWTPGSCTNGISELSKYFNIEINPNPAKNYIKLNINANSAREIKIDLVNTNGKLVKSIYKGNAMAYQNDVIDLEGINNGIYMILLQSEKHSLIQKVVLAD